MESSIDSCTSAAGGTCAASSTDKKQDAETRQAENRLRQNMSYIQNKILVMSGKGGVGKSSTAVNLALALAMQHQSVGLLDVDLHGPSVPKMLGVEEARLKMPGDELLPVNALGLKVMSLGFMLENPHDAVIWRGAMKHGVIRQLVAAGRKKLILAIVAGQALVMKIEQD